MAIIEDALIDQYKNELYVRRIDLGDYHPSVAETLNSIGLHHHHRTNDQTEALRYHTDALQILRHLAEDESNPDDELKRKCNIESAITLTDIGNVHKSMGDCEMAMKSYTAALDVFRALRMKDDHPRVAATHRCIERIDRIWTGEQKHIHHHHVITQRKRPVKNGKEIAAGRGGHGNETSGGDAGKNGDASSADDLNKFYCYLPSSLM
mmetsp:Transcript_4972/g.7395  ORF Transcript_4972/g.7395 Transcript_4972/m.7395 type:complete len:208 (+) Transcript_4972:96-719(+)